MNSDDLKKRTKEYAHRCVKLAISLPNQQLGNHIRNQLIRCGTSVAANYRAVCLAQSNASFVAKLSIVIEETDESIFWIDFLNDEELAKLEKTKNLRDEGEELLAIFCRSRLTAKKKSAKK